MSKDTTFTSATAVSSNYLNDSQEVLTGLAVGVRTDLTTSDTTVRIFGDPLTEDQYSVRVGLKPRYGATPVSVVGSGGAGARNIYLTSVAADSPKAPLIELQIPPATPSPAYYRKIAEGTWSGTAFTDLRLKNAIQADADQFNSFVFKSHTTASTPLTIRGLASHSADLLQLQDSASSVVLGVSVSRLILGEGFNVVLGTTTGSKIGTASTQKLGFYNATPIVRPTVAVVATDPTTTMALANSLRTVLVNLGLAA